MNSLKFQHAAGVSHELAVRWFPHINAAMKQFGIKLPVDQAMFFAQIGHESQGFKVLVENLNYAADRLVPVFGIHRISTQQAAEIGRTATRPANQPAIANLVYGGKWGRRNLGNIQLGDGWVFRGRGLKQITGRSNYGCCGEALNLDLIISPVLLEQDDVAASSAAWFYVSSGCLNHSGDIEKITRIINGGLNGIDDRKLRFKRAQAALQL